MARRHRRGGNRLLRQALLESRVKYGPELRGLRELLKEARTDYKIGVRAEKGAAEGIQAAADEAMPTIRRIYKNAGKDAGTADQDVQKALAGLGSGADAYKAITVGESHAARQRLDEAMAGAQTDVQSRKVQAAEGRHYAIQNLQGQYAQQVGKIHGQAQALQGDIGAFAQARYGDLRQADRKLRVQIRGQNITLKGQRLTHQDRVRGQNITKHGQELQHADRVAGRRAKGKGTKAFTRAQLRSARAMWGKGVTLLRAHPPKRNQYRQVLEKLVKGGVDRTIAVGAWETYWYGGVRKHTRHVLQRDYGLKPRVMTHARVKLTPGIQLRF